MLYELKNLTRNYDGRNVLDLSLSMEKGRVTGLLGPNGAGKTTLLEILAFLSSPASGEIYYRGSRVDFAKTALIRLRRSAVLVQQKPILFTASVFKNVEFPLKIRDMKKNEREKTVNQLLAMVGMDQFSRAKAHRLSGGETQRVAIAQALACSPEVILMDEPTASVDAENQIIIERIIRDINRLKGISVIFTTHDRLQASRIADDIVFIYKGRLTDSIHENIFSGFIERNSEGKAFCVIQDELKIPVKTDRTGQVRISLSPDAVDIIREPGDIEGSFNITGRVIQLSDEKGSIRILIDVGVPLTIIIHPDNKKGVLPGIGEHVWLTLNTEKIEVL
jgi:tungstate transport system ATP-binding protein